jgi:hypothetical protein
MKIFIFIIIFILLNNEKITKEYTDILFESVTKGFNNKLKSPFEKYKEKHLLKNKLIPNFFHNIRELFSGNFEDEKKNRKEINFMKENFKKNFNKFMNNEEKNVDKLFDLFQNNTTCEKNGGKYVLYNFQNIPSSGCVCPLDLISTSGNFFDNIRKL